MGVDVLLDDREERPGVKFKEADLLGIPVKVVVGKGLAEGTLEVSLRRSGDQKEAVAAVEAASYVSELVRELRAEVSL